MGVVKLDQMSNSRALNEICQWLTCKYGIMVIHTTQPRSFRDLISTVQPSIGAGSISQALYDEQVFSQWLKFEKRRIDVFAGRNWGMPISDVILQRVALVEISGPAGITGVGIC